MSTDRLSPRMRDRLLSAVLRDPLFSGAQDAPVRFHPRSVRLLPNPSIDGVVSIGSRDVEMGAAEERTIQAMAAASLHAEIHGRSYGYALAFTAAVAAAGSLLLLLTAMQIVERLLSSGTTESVWGLLLLCADCILGGVWASFGSRRCFALLRMPFERPSSFSVDPAALSAHERLELMVDGSR